MTTRKIILYTLMILLLSLLLGCLSNKSPKEDNLKEDIWCNSKINISYNNGMYVVKGLTDYNNRQVCEVYIEKDDGSITQYFSKGGGYMVMIYKDKNGSIIKELDISNKSGDNGKK